MKSGALAFTCTPFLQAFHGYPSHYQNFTHIGHRRLFERAGFDVVESGVAAGPGWAISDLVATFIGQCTPSPLKRPAWVVWRMTANVLIRPLDKWLSERPDAYFVASTTFVLLTKP
jgi:hypothetical protein